MQSNLVKNLEITEDYLLGGRVLIRQPAQGYRVAIDPIFLAASIDVQENESVLDIGAGVGAASLCLAYRVPGCKIVGLELQRSNVRLAMENIALNNMRGRVEVLMGDLLQPPPVWQGEPLVMLWLTLPIWKSIGLIPVPPLISKFPTPKGMSA
ncbi:methyltransferase [Candidatus Odyssella thessalonicensis]|uniref:methyltransferase n=1 Tax=Candidatus Odyssella thessalonicensis TaxID=84647 RepID=UPI0002EDDBA6|nr:methyltransferase [Candidatus Odyssella thessalonicensis]